MKWTMTSLFRNFLILSVSSLALIQHARAAEISTTTTASVRTSTADDGQPGDIEITDDGSIEVSETPGFTAVTIDSPNDVTIDGSIEIEDSDDTIGVLIEPGLTSNLTISGSIALTEDYSREDTDDDDDDDGPLAIGTGRTAIRLNSGGPLTGSIRMETGSSLRVAGNDSAGILLLDDLLGDLVVNGTISVVGDNAQAITVSGIVDGSIAIRGAVSVQGENATGLRLDSGATGAVSIGGSITSTGFAYTSSTNYIAPVSVTSSTEPLEERFDSDELLVGGSGVIIGGSLGQGLLVNGAAADPDPSDDESEDETKDTIEDFNENRSSGRITSYGSAPALLISSDWNGSANGDLVLGGVVESVLDTLDDDDDDDTDEVLAQFTYEYGLINRGTISGVGTNVGFDGTAIVIEGSESSGNSVIIEGGIYNSGTIYASAYEANATALHLGTNTSVPTLVNTGSIQSTISTEVSTVAKAILIEEGATLSTLENSGTIQARSTGNAGEVVAVLDQSGSLSSIVNTGTVTASYSSDGLELTLREDAVAFDLSANTSGVTIHQYEREATYDANGDDEIDSLDTLDPSITGQIIFGSGDDLLQLDGGTLVGDVTFGSGANQLYASDTEIEGDVSFTGTSSILRLLNGSSLTGDIDFGNSGTSSLFEISGGSTFSGALSNSRTGLDILISDSRARLSSGTAVSADSLTIGNGSNLIIEIDPGTTFSDAVFDVAGTAALSDGVDITPEFTRVLNTSGTYTVIRASDILADLESGDVSLSGDLPFIYQTDLVLTDGVTDSLDIVYRLKSSDELGMDTNQAAAFSSALELFENSDTLDAAFAGITDESAFFQAYNQLLPQRTDSSTRLLRAQSTATYGALSDQMRLLAESPGEGAKAWLQETHTFTDIDASEGVPGYNGSGVAFAGGINFPVASLDAFGVMMNFASGSYEEKTGGNKPVSTDSTGIGLYALKRWDELYLSGAGQVSKVNFNSLRELDIISGERDSSRADADVLDTQDITDQVTADWGGTSFSATAALGTTFKAGGFFARPELSADFFHLNQDAYREKALRNTGLALKIGAAETERASATAMLAIGRDWEIQNGTFRIFPEARVGFRHELLGKAYKTTASFIDSDQTFEIASQEEFGDSVLAGFSFNSSSSIFTARLSYDIEMSEAGTSHYVGASGVLKF